MVKMIQKIPRGGRPETAMVKMIQKIPRGGSRKKRKE